MDTKKTLQDKLFEMGEFGRLAHTPVHIREKEYQQKMVELAKEYEIPDFKIFYGNNRYYTYCPEPIVEHDNVIYVDYERDDGTKVTAMHDLADSEQMAVYRKKVKDLSLLYGYNRFCLIYDGFREFSLNYNRPKSDNKNIIKF